MKWEKVPAACCKIESLRESVHFLNFLEKFCKFFPQCQKSEKKEILEYKNVEMSIRDINSESQSKDPVSYLCKFECLK